MRRTAMPVIEKDGKITNCPYCHLKEILNTKIVYKSSFKLRGECKCGAFLDEGQWNIEVNSRKEMYEGVLRLIGEIVDQVNSILDFHDIEIPYDDDELPPNVFLRNAQIVRDLFVPYVGQTTLLNFMNALGIDEYGEEEWQIGVK